MLILSHRGYWKETSEKNKEVSFFRSFEHGFGTETDIRDFNGDLVISHDMATGAEIRFSELLSILGRLGADLPLALNVKADGLQHELKRVLQEYNYDSYFVFDMSVPDALAYKEADIRFYSRVSEYEGLESVLPGSSGVWLDSFKSDWFDGDTINFILNRGLNLAIVSSELHGRSFEAQWEMIKSLDLDNRVMLCTDFPEKARMFFDEKN